MKRFFKEGESCYFMHMKVDIKHIFECFHLVEVAEVDTERNFFVDVCTLSDKPDLTNSISLRILGRNTIEYSVVH